MKVIILVSLCAILIGCASPQPSETSPSTKQVSSTPTAALIDTLPAAKEGYSWVGFQNTFLLKPDGWHENSKDNTFAVSLNPIDANGLFETGATVLIFRDIPGTHHQRASALAKQIIGGAAGLSENTVIYNGTERKSRGVSQFVLKYHNAPKGLIPIQVHQFFVADNNNGAVYIFTFETTNQKWEEHWNKEGMTIMRNIVVRPNAG